MTTLNLLGFYIVIFVLALVAWAYVLNKGDEARLPEPWTEKELRTIVIIAGLTCLGLYLFL
ncbi:MAG: hypothetical protein Q8Q08_13010 [Candidatus Omnitrophota bacterium]|nr:hypothetical protein [Candidatus Omnitrophota bacterium]